MTTTTGALSSLSPLTSNLNLPTSSAPITAGDPSLGNPTITPYTTPTSTTSPAVTGYAPAPNLGVTPGATQAGTFTQGAALPNITTSQEQVTAAPSFYTDYLNQLATQGAQANQNSQFVGPTNLQTAAFNNVASNVGNYIPTLNAATGLTQSAAGDLTSNINDLMNNSATTNLVNSIGNLGQANIAQNLAPQATAGIVGAGGFGSQRGTQALGEVLANAGLGVTAQQAAAEQAAYNQATQAGLQEQANQLGAANQLGNLASTTQSLGLGDVNALATLGGQQQTIAQNQQNFPMQGLTNEAALLKGFTVPTSVSSSYTGPIPGAYAASPLQQIAGLGALAAGVSQTNLGTAIGNALGGLGTGLSNMFSSNTGGSPTAQTSTPTFTQDANGNTIVTVDGVSYNSSGESLGP
jgi:hypothetical protein